MDEEELDVRPLTREEANQFLRRLRETWAAEESRAAADDEKQKLETEKARAERIDELRRQGAELAREEEEKGS